MGIPAWQTRIWLGLVLVLVVIVGCGADGGGAAQPSTADDQTALTERLAAIDDAVERWRGAADLVEAKRAAEAARNLVVGPAGPFYGDADGDGTVEGASEIGLLPGLHGEPGIASPDDGSCVERDVLGGSWSDPAARWDEATAAIDAWSAANNPFPTLASHPQRLVGWATLSLASNDLAEVHEFGGHAHLHIDISTQAATACDV